MRKHPSEQSLAGLAGMLFVTLGIVGFVPGAVTHYAHLRWCGNESGAELFGLFQTSIVLNLVRLGFGVVGLFAGKAVATARAYLLGGGTLFVALGAYGALVDRTSDANVLPVDYADNVLHFVLGAGLVALALLTSSHLRERTA
jgi:hypothetical protein